MSAHDHEDHELAWSLNGSIVIETHDARWNVDTSQALWIPAGVAHTVHRRSGALIFPVFLPAGQADDPVGRVAAIARSPELRQLVDARLQRLLTAQTTSPGETGELLDAIGRHARPYGSLTLPRDAGARAVAAELLRVPDSRRTLEQWAASFHIGSKTLQRRFKAETGVPFSAWRHRARLMTAQSLLANGDSVSEVALQVGFSTPSAFIHSFKREFGLTPRRYRMQASGLS